MTVKQLKYRISRTEEALAREKQKNNEKTARVGWGSGFRKQYTGPCCSREMELEERLRGYRAQLMELEAAAAGTRTLPNG